MLGLHLHFHQDDEPKTYLWVRKALDSSAEFLAANVPEDEIPKKRKFGEEWPDYNPQVDVSRVTYEWDELGCGSFGCVYAIDKKNVVCKITRDPTEIQFVTTSLKLGESPSGIVEYHRIIQLPYMYRKKPVYAIWREEAHNVGNLSRYDHRSWLVVAAFKSWGSFAKEIIDKSTMKDKLTMLARRVVYYRDSEFFADPITDWYISVGFDPENKRKFYFGDYFEFVRVFRSEFKSIKGIDAAAVAIVFCEKIAEHMWQTPEVNLIGETLMFYLKHGILLADVHQENIGQVIREENYNEPVWVITDPGHMVYLGQKYTGEYYTAAWTD
jgi:hypothetical protein